MQPAIDLTPLAHRWQYNVCPRPSVSVKIVHKIKSRRVQKKVVLTQNSSTAVDSAVTTWLSSAWVSLAAAIVAFNCSKLL